jgi:hypothetical protein
MMISQETLDGILAGEEHEVHTFIHEFIHGFTTSKIVDYNIERQGLIPGFKSKLTVKEKNAIEQLQRIFEKVKRDNPKSKEYGFTNLDEFIAEAFSNSGFQYTLKNTKAEGKKSNLFSEFINAVGDILFEQLERWAKRFNKEIPDRETITGILEDVLAWTEDLIDQNNKLAYIATNEEINAKYDAELKALEQSTSTTQSNIEAKKADIERRRQEELIANIYTQLGDKTVSGNVTLKSVYQQAGIDFAKSIGGIFSLRVTNSNKHFGNPFSSVPSEIAKGLIATKSTKESVEKYIDWVLFSNEERAKWIREQLKSGNLKNKPIIYYNCF